MGVFVEFMNIWVDLWHTCSVKCCTFFVLTQGAAVIGPPEFAVCPVAKCNSYRRQLHSFWVDCAAWRNGRTIFGLTRGVVKTLSQWGAWRLCFSCCGAFGQDSHAHVWGASFSNRRTCFIYLVNIKLYKTQKETDVLCCDLVLIEFGLLIGYLTFFSCWIAADDWRF